MYGGQHQIVLTRDLMAGRRCDGTNHAGRGPIDRVRLGSRASRPAQRGALLALLAAAIPVEIVGMRYGAWNRADRIEEGGVRLTP